MSRLCDRRKVRIATTARRIPVVPPGASSRFSLRRRSARTTMSDMPKRALMLLVVWLAVVGGLQGTIYSRRTGEMPVRFHDHRYAPQWWARLISTFGVMFTPNQEKAASEMLRVCRSGGKIGLANWTPDGFIGALFKVIGRNVPPPAGIGATRCATGKVGAGPRVLWARVQSRHGAGAGRSDPVGRRLTTGRNGRVRAPTRDWRGIMGP